MKKEDWIDFDIYFPFPIVEFVIKPVRHEQITEILIVRNWGNFYSNLIEWNENENENWKSRYYYFNLNRIKKYWCVAINRLYRKRKRDRENVPCTCTVFLFSFWSIFWPAFPPELSSPAIQENKKKNKNKNEIQVFCWPAAVENQWLKYYYRVDPYIEDQWELAGWMSFTKETLGIIYGQRADISIYI